MAVDKPVELLRRYSSLCDTVAKEQEMAERPQDQGDLHDDSGVNSGRSSKSMGDIKVSQPLKIPPTLAVGTAL